MANDKPTTTTAEPAKPKTEREKQREQKQIDRSLYELTHRNGGRGHSGGKVRIFK